MTDPPMSLTGLIKQRRRWFNGSLFASFYVLKHMCRVWGRSKCSCCRNLFIMLLYLYLIIQVLLYFVIVGVFYAVFSIFLRAILPSDKCLNVTEAANLIENIYLVFLGLILMLSISVDISWAENGYRVCSIFMGLFTILMVACSVFYALDATFESLGVIFLVAFILSYLIPLILNCRNIRLITFLKGAVYATYLSPTYINILTIYAISNIHDVSWGSRPTESNALLQAVEKRKGILYRNFRANFLIFWVILNVAVAAGIIYLDREEVVDVIFYLGAFLLAVITFKITFAVMSYIKAKIDRFRVYRLVKKRKSTVFDDIGKIKELNKEEVFQVYYDYDGNYKATTDPSDPDYLNANFKTSIHSQKTFRGFNLARLTEQHRIQQGLIGNFLGKLGTRTFYKEDVDNIVDSVHEDDDEEDKKTDESASLLNSPDPAMRAKISRLFMRSLAGTDTKIKFEDVVESHNKVLSDVNIEPAEEAKESVREERKDKQAAPPPSSPSAEIISSSSSRSAEDVSPESDYSESDDGRGSDRVDSSSQIEGKFDCINSITKNYNSHRVYQLFLSD